MRVCPVCRLRYHDDSVFCLVDGERLETVADPRIGQMIGGRYALLDVVGRGGMATVYKALQSASDRHVAVKILHDRVAEDTKLRKRFSREAQRAATLAHPNIVEIYDHGQTDGLLPYIVMELLEGEPLDQALARRTQMPGSEVIALGLQIARGLSRAHDFDIVHRDVKPENIFICRSDDGEPVVKIVDFGIAHASGDPRLTGTGEMVGSPRYMAPERFHDRAHPTPQSDLYALGIVLFEMVTGTPPFRSESMAGYILHHLETTPPRLRSVAPGCPAALDQLVAELLAKDAAHRPVDAHAVVAALSAMAPAAARRVRRASTFSQQLPPGSQGAGGQRARVDGWARRVHALRTALERRWPADSAPPELRNPVLGMHQGVRQLEALLSKASEVERELATREEQLRLDRERLGHAVQTLAEDLSRARKASRRAGTTPGPGPGSWASAYRQALATAIDLDARNPELPTEEALGALREAADHYERWMALSRHVGVDDLEFQLSALRDQLARREDEAAVQKARLSAAIERNAQERTEAEVRLVQLSQDVADELTKRPELRSLLDRP